jgi:hypothetical protein
MGLRSTAGDISVKRSVGERAFIGQQRTAGVSAPQGKRSVAAGDRISGIHRAVGKLSGKQGVIVSSQKRTAGDIPGKQSAIERTVSSQKRTAGDVPPGKQNAVEGLAVGLQGGDEGPPVQGKCAAEEQEPARICPVRHKPNFICKLCLGK